MPRVPAGSNGLQHFRSRPDLTPASITVTRNSAPASNGDIFLTPQFGPTQNGPMILDPSGKLVWFQPTPITRNTLFTDFRVQNLHGQPVLTWWQGSTNAGSGRGVGVIFNQNYREIATVHAGNGLDADLHEFLVTPQGAGLHHRDWPRSTCPAMRGRSWTPQVQEIDIATGLVMFSWDALDHIPLSTSSSFGANVPGHILDPFHLNSVSLDSDGNLIVSARNTSAVYKINRLTGQIIWTLGGKKSSFKMGRGTTTAFQHDAIVQPDGTITMFDDGGGPPRVHQFSRGVRISARHHAHDRVAGPGVRPSAADRVGLRGRRAGPCQRRHLRRLGPAALLHRVRLTRQRELRRPLHGADLELPRLPLPVERAAADDAGARRRQRHRRHRQAVGELERRDRRGSSGGCSAGPTGSR